MKRKRRNKFEMHNLKQKFIALFSSGKYQVLELSRILKVNKNVAYKWKIEHFGTGILRDKRIYQMHKAELPSKTIAEFYNVHIVQVHKSIRTERKKERKVDYNNFPTGILIDCLPENKPLYKDSGLWTIYNDDFKTPIFEQNTNEDFRQFLIRYYKFIFDFKQMDNLHIDLDCSNLHKYYPQKVNKFK